MANPLLRYLDNTSWTDGIDQARALGRDEYKKEVLGPAAGVNGGAVTGAVRVRSVHAPIVTIQGDSGPRVYHR